MKSFSETLLQAKISAPASRHGFVPRRRLLEKLDRGLENRLTMISAPAGYGKTTLLCEWIASHPSDVPFAWLTMDEGDNNPTIFLQYAIAALQAVDTEIGQSLLPALQTANPPSLAGFLPSLLNQINQRKDKIVLILDDYHLVTEQSVHQIIEQFIEGCSAGLQVVIATRADPPLPVHRYRARGELTEIRQAQLSFTPEETQDFLQQTVGDLIQQKDIEFLHQRTEGWAVGLVLAGLSIHEGHKVLDSTASLSGNQAYIMEYLVNEVFERQSDRIKDFLLKTSILKRLTGSLCDQLTSFKDGHEILEFLKSKNLFVSALDDEQVWYRYHQLFADLLRRRLELEYKDTIPSLHKAASEWYAQNGFLIEAIEQAAASRDYPYEISLIEGFAEKLLSRGEQALLLKQLQALPPEIIHTSVPVCLWYSVILLFREQFKRAGELLQVAGELIQKDAILAGQHAEKVLGIQEFHAAYLALQELNLDQVIQHAQQAFEHIPKDWQTLRQMLQMMVADASNWRGDAIEAGQLYAELLEGNTLQQNPYLFFVIGIRNALLNLDRGRLFQVHNSCSKNLKWLGELKPRWAHYERSYSLILMEVLIEWNRLEDVRDQLDSAFEQLKHLERSSWDIQCLCIVRGYLALHNSALASQVLKILEDGIRSSQMPQAYLSRVLAWKARINLLVGNITYAEEVLAELGQVDPDQIAYQFESAYFAMIRLWLVQGKFQKAATLLEGVKTNARQGGRVYALIEALILHATAEAMQGHRQAAQQSLAQAIALAEPEGFIRIFIEEGAVVRNLLEEMVSAGQGSPYIQQLIAAFDSTLEPIHAGRKNIGLIEPFSERELQVLRLLQTHLSQQEMADELCVSVNTIRFHTKNIYRKLGAHERSEAVGKAKATGLL